MSLSIDKPFIFSYIKLRKTKSRGMFINFYGCALENVFNPIACDCKIKNMIKGFKEKAIKHKINEIEKDFV